MPDALARAGSADRGQHPGVWVRESDPRDSGAGVIAGHGRLLAARLLALEEVPVVVLDHLSDTQRRAYIIADNKLAMNAGWNLSCWRRKCASWSGKHST